MITFDSQQFHLLKCERRSKAIGITQGNQISAFKVSLSRGDVKSIAHLDVPLRELGWTCCVKPATGTAPAVASAISPQEMEQCNELEKIVRQRKIRV